MSSTTQGMDSNSSKSVSTFDLEPNPFEQSFASTKKAGTGASSFQVDNGIRASEAQKSVVIRDKSLPTTVGSANGNASVVGNPNSLVINEVADNGQVAQIDTLERSRLSSLMYGAERPNIHSPPQLTPGGSKRLPPILLSPSFMHQGMSSGPNLNGIPHNQIGGHVPNATSPPATNMSSGATTAESLKSGYFLGLPKTGLTPNESNMRTGLTPILGAVHNLTHHPPFTTLPSFSNVKPESDFNNMENNHQMPSRNFNQIPSGISHNGASNTGDSASFSSGLGSILGLATTASQPNSSVIQPAVSNRGGPSLVSASQSKTISPSKSINVKEEQDVTATVSAAPAAPAAPAVAVGNTSKSRKRKSSNTMSPTQTTAGKRKSSSSSKNNKFNKKNHSGASESPHFTETDNSNKESNANIYENYDDDDQDKRRKEFLERNRVAASKFRRRKKEYIKKVEVDLKFYESEYDDLSHAIDKVCGIVQDSPHLTGNHSLIAMLETAITKNDVPSSLSILAHIKQVIHETNYFQRNGKNPRRDSMQQESDDDDRRRSDAGLSNKNRSRHASMSSGTQQRKDSLDNYNGNNRGPFSSMTHQPPSSESNLSFSTDATTISSSSKNDAIASGLLPLSLVDEKEQTSNPVASAIGTISTLPDIINGTQVIPLINISNRPTNDNKTISEARQSSVTGLPSDTSKLAPDLAKYPNSD